MITSLIIAIVSAWLLSGGARYLLHPKLRKSVKKRVADEGRLDAVLVLIDTAEAVMKSLGSRLEIYEEALRKASRDQGTSADELGAVCKAILAAHQRTRVVFVDLRLPFQQLLTEEEWAEVLKDAGELSERDIEKRKKDLEGDRLKAFRWLDEALPELGLSADQNAAASQLVESLVAAFERLLVAEVGWNLQGHEILRDHSATREALMAGYENLNLMREECFDLFVQLHGSLVAGSDPKNWKKVGKALARFF